MGPQKSSQFILLPEWTAAGFLRCKERAGFRELVKVSQVVVFLKYIFKLNYRIITSWKDSAIEKCINKLVSIL